MNSEPHASSSAAPDRLFARATALLLCAGLGIVIAAHAVLDRAQARQARGSELAMLAAGEAAAAREVLVALDRLATLPEGDADRTAATRLSWDLDRLMALEERRLALTPGMTDPRTADKGALGELAEAARALAAGGPAGASAAELQARLEGRLLPQLDLIATRSRSAADDARLDGRWVLLGSLILHVLAGLLLFGAVLQPTRRRIDAWMARTAEEHRENRFRMLHDPLTGMPNAAYFQAYLARLAGATDREAGQTAVLRVDLDRFMVLREALGARSCDEVLRIAARRIRKAMRAGDFAAYLGQDDFVVVASALDDANDAAMIAARVQAALGKPFSISGGARRLSCGIGVTLLSDDRPEAERALANAEIALAEAQAAGPGNVRYFREGMRLEVERREALFAELLSGLDAGQILPHFQPQVEVATGAFCGFEALVRWQHPLHGLLEPEAFLDFAEQTDLTERIGELVLSRSLEALKAWDAAGLAVPRVGVNFALAQLGDPRLIEKIKWETERFGIDPERIAIEVLETVLIRNDAELVVRNLRGLASAGFHVELDDFGTGHASIANLRRFMVNRIKIDRSFIADIEVSEEQQTLTASMIAMAHALGIGTLAEGVETEAALAMLERLGCDQAQGYLVARPMSLAETLLWLGARGADPQGQARRGGAPGADPNTP